MSYFPMFIELQNCPCLVVGGGSVALRKVKVLRDFGGAVTVVAPEIQEPIRCLEDVCCQERSFEETDLENVKLVVAATDDNEQNHRISQMCRTRGIPVNAVDQQEDCDFIFPSYIREGEVVAAFSSGGQSPVVTQYLKRENKPIVTAELGELAAELGKIREEVKSRIAAEEGRKAVYQEILSLGLRLKRVPKKTEIENILNKYE
jgi:uroporphyrin-III C-methyltransferase/precorrin-2 dehydrogenase/sirohydrochlorin ferrochelatase/precorrin-2 dehydrogenase/sirohydrochlorin ferrochelatase